MARPPKGTLQHRLDVEAARARTVARLKAERLKARAGMIDDWLTHRALVMSKPGTVIDDIDLSKFEPTERELFEYCVYVASDPRLLPVHEHLGRNMMEFYLARAYLEQRGPLPPLTQQQTADLIDTWIDAALAQGQGPDGLVDEVREAAAKQLGRTKFAVERAHQRFGRHKGRKGRPRKSDK